MKALSFFLLILCFNSFANEEKQVSIDLHPEAGLAITSLVDGEAGNILSEADLTFPALTEEDRGYKCHLMDKNGNREINICLVGDRIHFNIGKRLGPNVTSSASFTSVPAVDGTPVNFNLIDGKGGDFAIILGTIRIK
jgi:hypothetical protein